MGWLRRWSCVPRRSIPPSAGATPRRTAEHRGKPAHAGHGVEHAGRAVRHQHVLREVPVGFLVLGELLVRDRDQARVQAGSRSRCPPTTRNERRRARSSCARVSRRAYASEIENCRKTPNSHLPGVVPMDAMRKRLDRHPAAGDEHRRDQRMADPEREVARQHGRGRAAPTAGARARDPDRIVEDARGRRCHGRGSLVRPDLARSSSAMRNWKIQLASSCGWLVPRNTLFSRRQLRIARSVCGTSPPAVSRGGDACTRCRAPRRR